MPIHLGDVVQITTELWFRVLPPGSLVTVRRIDANGNLDVETDWGAKIPLNRDEYRRVRVVYFISYSHKEGFGNYYSYRTSRLDSPKAIESERREYAQAQPDFRGIVILNITQIGIEPYGD